MRSDIILFFTLCGFVHSKLINLSCSQISDFVDGHNSRRLRLAEGKVSGQPAAANMKYVIWDDELAAKASKWASRNEFAHNPDRNLGSGRFTTGENVYSFGSTDPVAKISIDKSLSAWFDEYKYYSYGPLTMQQFDGTSKYQIGHYTQMAWADTTYVGCGISQYWKDDMKNYLVVCNYGPSGNILGQPPYTASEEGAGALECSVGDCSQPYGDTC